MMFFEQKIHAQMGMHGDVGRLKRFTIGDLMGAVLAINSDDDAKAFYESYVAWLTAHLDPASVHTPRSRLEGTPAGIYLLSSQQIACDNIGWCFGEGMSRERIAMWRRTTPAAHPVLPITENHQPTAQECLDAGLRAGRALRKA